MFYYKILKISALTSQSASAYELMSRRMTSTYFADSYAKYSAVLRNFWSDNMLNAWIIFLRQKNGLVGRLYKILRAISEREKKEENLIQMYEIKK
jgi:hypothetical protein